MQQCRSSGFSQEMFAFKCFFFFFTVYPERKPLLVTLMRISLLLLSMRIVCFPCDRHWGGYVLLPSNYFAILGTCTRKSSPATDHFLFLSVFHVLPSLHILHHNKNRSKQIKSLVGLCFSTAADHETIKWVELFWYASVFFSFCLVFNIHSIVVTQDKEIIHLC